MNKDLYQSVKNARDGYKNIEVEVDQSYKINVRNRVYPKSCYNKSWDYMLGHDIENMVLVHGNFTLFGLKWGHAWVEIDNVIFDGVYQRFYDKDLYYAELGLVKDIGYTQKESAKLGVYYRHKGPWVNE